MNVLLAWGQTDHRMRPIELAHVIGIRRNRCFQFSFGSSIGFFPIGAALTAPPHRRQFSTRISHDIAAFPHLSLSSS